MDVKPIVLPLADDGRVFGLFDESGHQIASGSREVCDTLCSLLTASAPVRIPPEMARTCADPRVRRPAC